MLRKFHVLFSNEKKKKSRKTKKENKKQIVATPYFFIHIFYILKFWLVVLSMSVIKVIKLGELFYNVLIKCVTANIQCIYEKLNILVLKNT